MLHLLKVHLLFHELSFLTNLAGNQIPTFYHMHRQEGRWDVQTPMNPKVGHVYNIPTMQFLTFLNSVNILSYLLLTEWATQFLTDVLCDSWYLWTWSISGLLRRSKFAAADSNCFTANIVKGYEWLPLPTPNVLTQGSLGTQATYRLVVISVLHEIDGLIPMIIGVLL